MTEQRQLVALNNRTHQHTRIALNSPIQFAARQHVMHIRAAEVGKAVSCFPVFISRSPSTGSWVLSAVCGFESGKNLFVADGAWAATYEPAAMKTYPLYLMQSPQNESDYAVGIDESSHVVSKDDGAALFDANGKASIFLSQMTALLEATIEDDRQSDIFANRMDELGLFKSINVNVHYDDDAVQTITGLHTIDEDRLQSLATEQIEELHKNGYLLIANAMLISIFQLNVLVRRYNKVPGNDTIKHVKLAIARDIAATEARS